MAEGNDIIPFNKRFLLDKFIPWRQYSFR